jgi:imidazoleglycerol phosphate dehydratase HisB
MIEAAFKALARSLKEAVKTSSDWEASPSTKGLLD